MAVTLSCVSNSAHETICVLFPVVVFMEIIKELMMMLMRRTMGKYEGARKISMSCRSCRSNSSGVRSSKNRYNGGGL